MDPQQKQTIVTEVLQQLKGLVRVPIGISNHHLHLTETVLDQLFPGQSLTLKKPLTQPGEFASEQTVTIQGPKGTLKNVRILGPCRDHCQVEVSATDARQLGVVAPLRLSGDVGHSPGVDLISPTKTVHLDQGLIIAKRHLHIAPQEAKLLGLQKGEQVNVAVATPRGLIFQNVEVRPGAHFKLEMHVDTDEANAGQIKPGTFGHFVD
jgi:phosphate propanoyltransferase